MCHGTEMTVLDALCMLWNGDARWSGPLDACCVHKLLTFVEAWLCVLSCWSWTAGWSWKVCCMVLYW